MRAHKSKDEILCTEVHFASQTLKVAVRDVINPAKSKTSKGLLFQGCEAKSYFRGYPQKLVEMMVCVENMAVWGFHNCRELLQIMYWRFGDLACTWLQQVLSMSDGVCPEGRWEVNFYAQKALFISVFIFETKVQMLSILLIVGRIMPVN